MGSVISIVLIVGFIWLVVWANVKMRKQRRQTYEKAMQLLRQFPDDMQVRENALRAAREFHGGNNSNADIRREAELKAQNDIYAIIGHR